MLHDWITSYIEYVKDTEPPKSFHTWIAVSAIAGAMQRRLWTQYGHSSVYANMYIVLVGKSGGARKGTAMDIAKDIINDVQGINLCADSITREKLIRKLADISQPTMCADSVVRTQAALTCFSGELSVFIGQRDIAFLSNLTDFFDSHNEWKYETKNKGEDHIRGICLNLLGATAPDWMQSMLPVEAVGGGFTSRVIFVYEERKGKSVSEEPYNEWHVKRREELVNDLNMIATLTGEFQRTDAARLAYNAWYTKQDKEMQGGKYVIDDPRFVGYCERRATHIRKLMMIMCVSRKNKLVIDKVDFDRALELLETVEKKMVKSFGGLGKSAYSEAVELVLDYLIVHKKATRSELMRQFYRDIDSHTFKIVEEVLDYMKVVKISIDIANNEVSYTLIM